MGERSCAMLANMIFENGGGTDMIGPIWKGSSSPSISVPTLLMGIDTLVAGMTGQGSMSTSSACDRRGSKVGH